MTQITRLPLPLPWGGHVYPTLIEAPGLRLLIDSGHWTEDSREALNHALGDAPLDALILTHAHQDHYGGLPALLARQPELPVYAHRSAVSYYGDQGAAALAHRDQLALFADRHGIGGALREQVLRGYETIAVSGCGATISHPLDDGDVLRFGPLELRVHHTPGHQHHHIVLELPQHGQCITGDMVFARGLAPPQVRFDARGQRTPCLPLLIDSLRRLEAVGGAALPSHGPELPKLSVAAAAARRAYLRTAERVGSAIGDGPAPPLMELLEMVFGDVPTKLVGLRLGFLLGYADVQGWGDAYR